MKTVKLKLKGNCANSWEMEGYVEAIKHKKGENYEELTFKLTSINTKIGEDVSHYTPIKVIVNSKNKIDAIMKWLKPMMLVTAKGNYKLGKNGGHCMAGQYIVPSEPYMVERDFNMWEESDERKEV